MSEHLALYLLGPPKLELNNAPIFIDRRKALALFAYLAVDRWRHQREQVSSLLWPEYDQARAFTNLRHELWEVRQALGDSWLDAGRDTIKWSDQAEVWLDVTQFEALIAQSLRQRNRSLRINLLFDSVKLYRNHFLAGFSLKDAPAFNEWIFTHSEKLCQQLARALTRLVEDLSSSGQLDTAIPHAQQLVALDALNEASHRQLMQIYLQAGQTNAALKQYQSCERILRKELGVDPQPETRLLYKQIRRGEVKLNQSMP